MEKFEFYNPVRIFFGKDQIPEIAGQIASGSHVMVIYGSGSISRNGVYDKIREALKEFILSEFGGIEPNPLYETAMKAVAKIKEENVDFL
jgi:NADP-dependent alcohol dehydrogenase